MTAEELLEAAKATDLGQARKGGEGRSFDTYYPSVKYFRDQGMSYTWIFNWCQERHPELSEDRKQSFVASMSGRYRRQQRKLTNA